MTIWIDIKLIMTLNEENTIPRKKPFRYFHISCLSVLHISTCHFVSSINKHKDLNITVPTFKNKIQDQGPGTQTFIFWILYFEYISF